MPGTRIVQARRFPVWAPGAYSIVRFSLAAADGGTELTIDQHGVPEDWHYHVHHQLADVLPHPAHRALLPPSG